MPPLKHRSSFGGLFSWALYDWANSSVHTVILTFIFASYFTSHVAVDENTGSMLWGNMVSLSALFVALLGPPLGAIADRGGRRKPWILFFTLLSSLSIAFLWFIKMDVMYVLPGLVLSGLAILGVELAILFYNAMLPDIAEPDHVGRWSGWGWAVGYAGGLLCLVISLVYFVEPDPSPFGLDRRSAAHVRAIFPMVSAWYILFALPLFLFTPDTPSLGLSSREAVRDGFMQLIRSIRGARHYSHILKFLVARMIYIDSLGTIFSFGGIYAAGTFGMDQEHVILFGILLNITAGVGSILFASLDDRIGGKGAVLISLAGLIFSGGMILVVESVNLFWVFGGILGLFVGPVQSSSRSYMARVAPAEIRNEMFGLYVFSGKATAFVGPLLVGWITYLAGSQRAGMSSVIFLMFVGFVMLWFVPSDRPARVGES